MMRDYLSENEVTALVTQTQFVVPLCWGPNGVWIEGINPKQVEKSKRFVERMRKAKPKANGEEVLRG